MEKLKPMEIEKRSFEIISKELEGVNIDSENELVLKRVIHTSADFDYVKNLVFSKDVCKNAIEALKNGVDIVTDTNMAKSGINKTILKQINAEVHCFMADEDVAIRAKELGTTRAEISMEKAVKTLTRPIIFAIGNAPTALFKIKEMVEKGLVEPKLIVGVPVGFVNVVESKEEILSLDVPYIVARGRKGGSNVAAAIINALIYQIAR